MRAMVLQRPGPIEMALRGHPVALGARRIGGERLDGPVLVILACISLPANLTVGFLIDQQA